jgi:hypothetical protein
MPENLNDAPEFSDEELRAALKRVGRDARQAAFAAGQPVFIMKDGALVALYPDGTEKVLESLTQATTTAAERE